MAQLVRRAPRAFIPAVVAAALLLAPVAVAGLLGVIELPAALTRGLPPDVAERGWWLLAQWLLGFALACVLAVGAWWLGRARAR